MTIGWLAGTRRLWDTGEDEQVAAWAMFAPLRDALGLGSSMTARTTYYRRGFAFDDGTAGVFWDGIGRAAGGVMLTMRQTAFERLGEAAWPLVVGLTAGLHVSRLDLAADVAADASLTPVELYGLLAAARSRSRREHQVLTVDRSGGEKLTLGSRASESYLRVYVKGERIRHELELKQGAAGTAMARLLAGESLADVWASGYGRVVRWL